MIDNKTISDSGSRLAFGLLRPVPTALAAVLWAVTLAGANDIPATGDTGPSIPFAELGARAGAQYHGEGLSVLPSPQGARLRCAFQKLEGEVTPEGLWLSSAFDGATGERFRVVATSVARENSFGPMA